MKSFRYLLLFILIINSLSNGKNEMKKRNKILRKLFIGNIPTKPSGITTKILAFGLIDTLYQTYNYLKRFRKCKKSYITMCRKYCDSQGYSKKKLRECLNFCRKNSRRSFRKFLERKKNRQIEMEKRRQRQIKDLSNTPDAKIVVD